MIRKVRSFLRRDEAAVTVDWVVVTAIVLALTLLVFSIVTEAVLSDAGSRIGDMILHALTLVPRT